MRRPNPPNPMVWLGLRSCALALAFSTCVLTACSQPTPQSPTATVGPTAQATAAPTATPEIEPSATPLPPHFTLGLPNAPDTLDPAQAVDEAALLITRHLYEGLTAYEPGTTRARPALAANWTTTDAITWTFNLRSDVVFHDGTPFTAEAVRLNFERWINADPPGDYAFWQLMFGGFAGEADNTGQPLALVSAVTAPDDHTVVIVLNRPYAPLPNTLAMPSFAIVNPAAFSAIAQLETVSAGTGPYQLAPADTSALVQLVRNPVYWGPPPLPESLFFKAIADDAQRLLALQSGEVEGLARVAPEDYAPLQKDTRYRLEFDPALEVVYLGFNQARAPWGNLDCRLAVAHALDRARYAQALYPGDATVAEAMQPPAVWGYTALTTTRSFAAAEAQAYWERCRLTTTVPPTVTLYLPPLARTYLPDPEGLGQAIQQDLAQTLDLNVQVVSPAWPAGLQEVQLGAADLFVLGWAGVNGDPDAYLCPLFCGQAAAFNQDVENQPLPPDATLAELLLEARSTVDTAQREALYAQAHQRIFEVLPALPLVQRQTLWVYRADVQGSIPSPIENVFWGLYLEAP